MTKYREIIRLHSLNFSERNIALSCSVSRNTVSKVLKKADELNISWPLDETMTDDALENILFPREKSATNKRMPDYAYIRKELLRNGVSKSSCGANTVRIAAWQVKNLSCIHSFAITSSRMSKNEEQPCIYPENPVNKLK